MTETELLITAAVAAGVLLAVVAVAVLRIMWDVQAIREVNDAWYAEVTDEPAPRLFDRLALPTQFTPREGCDLDELAEQDDLEAGYARLHEAVRALDDEELPALEAPTVDEQPGSADAAPEPVDDPSPSAPVESPVVDEPPAPEFPCGGERKRHSYRHSPVEGRCRHCGAEQPDPKSTDKRASTTTAAEAAAWRTAHPEVARAENSSTPVSPVAVPPPPVADSGEVSPAASKSTHPWRAFRSVNGGGEPDSSTPVEDPSGAHITGPATSKASTTGATRAARRGGSDEDITVTGTLRGGRQAEDTYWDEQALADGWCPRGHGPMTEAPDEFGGVDTHCVTCGFRPTRRAEPGEGDRAPGKLRRREPSHGGVRI